MRSPWQLWPIVCACLGSGCFQDESLLAGSGGGDMVVVSAERTTFEPVADAYVRAATPSTCYGQRSMLTADLEESGPGDVEWIYLRFDLGRPTNGARALLKLYVVGGSSDSFNVHPISDNDWQERTIDWTNRPPLDGPVLDSIGASTTGEWLSIDVSSAIDANGRLSLALTPRSNDGVDLSSREGSHPPVLALTP